MHTEEEAKKKWCAQANDGSVCIASKCMMWRWIADDNGRKIGGYCGLAGVIHVG